MTSVLSVFRRGTETDISKLKMEQKPTEHTQEKEEEMNIPVVSMCVCACVSVCLSNVSNIVHNIRMSK